jgi:hypothetical protein
MNIPTSLVPIGPVFLMSNETIFYGYYHFQGMRVSLDSLSPYAISIYILQQIWPSSCLFPEIKGVQEINTQNDNFFNV